MKLLVPFKSDISKSGNTKVLEEISPKKLSKILRKMKKIVDCENFSKSDIFIRFIKKWMEK